MLNIEIHVIPHKRQRYPTVGDWYWNGNTLTILVSDLGDWKKESLVAHHELTEALLARAHGITTQQVDDFDMAFEAMRAQGLHSPEEEPGNDLECPIRKEHFFATSLERLLAAEIGVDWQEYEKQIEEL